MSKNLVLYLILVFNIKFAFLEREDFDEEWQGNWFPKPPDNINLESGRENTWQGKWFPKKPDQSELSSEVDTIDSWPGKWFPVNPEEVVNESNRPEMGVINDLCDNGIYNLQIDYDPDNSTFQQIYMCLENKDAYKPNANVEPIITYYQIPPAYVAMHRCMNEPIFYEERLPTFGTHRPLWPRYGEYSYVPPQRWLHSLEHGAIVALYHPCTNQNQIELLKNITKSCLRRHIITPYEMLLPTHSMALVAWGKSLEFSVYDEELLMDFIKQNALKGPEQIPKDGQYSKGLINPATNISTYNDDVLCPKSTENYF